MKIAVTSFSYKRGLSEDKTGNGDRSFLIIMAKGAKWLYR